MTIARNNSSINTQSTPTNEPNHNRSISFTTDETLKCGLSWLFQSLCYVHLCDGSKSLLCASCCVRAVFYSLLLLYVFLSLALKGQRIAVNLMTALFRQIIFYWINSNYYWFLCVCVYIYLVFLLWFDLRFYWSHRMLCANRFNYS